MGRDKVNLPPSGGADSEIGTEDGERLDYAPIGPDRWTATVNHYMLFCLRIQKQKTIDYTPWDLLSTIPFPIPRPTAPISPMRMRAVSVPPIKLLL